MPPRDAHRVTLLFTLLHTNAHARHSHRVHTLVPDYSSRSLLSSHTCWSLGGAGREAQTHTHPQPSVLGRGKLSNLGQIGAVFWFKDGVKPPIGKDS